MSTNTQDLFLELVRAGLWENCSEFQVPIFRFQDFIDWEKVYQLAEEQSVIGVVLAGIERSNVKPPQELLLQWIGEVQLLEQQNKAMNQFIDELIGKLRNADIYTLLIKGQGIAQIYERPQWRTCGDIDLLLSEDNFQKAETLLTSLSITKSNANPYTLHQAFSIKNWEVEIHGTLRSGLWKRLDVEIDKVQHYVFSSGSVRSWINGRNQIHLPGIDEDIVFVFIHILQHFFQEGIGLRQICDWCRLLWVYKDFIDKELLEKRLCSMGVMTEWKAFASLAVFELGMPSEGIPFFSLNKRWRRKADRILDFIFETGNFGHNRDYSYYKKYSYIVYKIISLWRHTRDVVKYFCIFPADALKIWFGMINKGFAVVRLQNGKNGREH